MPFHVEPAFLATRDLSGINQFGFLAVSAQRSGGLRGRRASEGPGTSTRTEEDSNEKNKGRGDLEGTDLGWVFAKGQKGH